DYRANVEQAAQAAEEFYQLYYEHFDKKRHMIKKLYQETATVVWNGHVVKGAGDIVHFFENLPSSQHTITSLDAVPLLDSLTPGHKTIMLTVFGTVKYNDEKNVKSFYQNFMLTSHDKVWKIISDTFRFLA
ncbi:hypothetical protein LOTGIDRAFT_136198, partial [Lottia gigantea]